MDEKSFLDSPDQRRGPSVMMGMQYIEAVGGIVPCSGLGFPPQAKEFWISAASNPPGRMCLERFATVLGESDAAMLGDGGNGYVFGSDADAGVFGAISLASRHPFSSALSASDAVAVWQKDKIFYPGQYDAVFSWSTLYMDAATKATRAERKAICSLRDGAAKYPCSPFELLVFNVIATKRLNTPTQN